MSARTYALLASILLVCAFVAVGLVLTIRIHNPFWGLMTVCGITSTAGLAAALYLVALATKLNQR